MDSLPPDLDRFEQIKHAHLYIINTQLRNSSAQGPAFSRRSKGQDLEMLQRDGDWADPNGFPGARVSALASA